MYGQRQQHQQHHGQQLESTSYPLMQVAEICDCLAALNIPIGQEDLAKPTAATAQHIYSSLVGEVMGAPLDMIEQPKDQLMDMLEYRDMYGDALSFTLFFKQARILAETCGVRNFTMSDLTRPDAARLRHHLSGIMNFAKYRDEKSALQQQLQEQNRRAADRMSKLQKQLERVEQSISEITAKNAADKPKTEEARARNDQLRDELLELRNSQMRLSHEVEELKKDRMTQNETATGKVNDVNQLQVAISSARSRLVQSPDRIKKHISEMRFNLDEDKARLAAAQRKVRELSNRSEIISTLETDLKSLIDMSKGIEHQRGRVEDVKRKLHSLRQDLDATKIESSSYVTKTQQLQRQLEIANDRHARTEASVTEMRAKSGKRIEDLKAEYKVLSKQRGVVLKEREVLLKEKEQLEADMDGYIRGQEEELNLLLEEYWNMREQADDYLKTISTKLGLEQYL